jgi:hypothetical protein
VDYNPCSGPGLSDPYLCTQDLCDPELNGGSGGCYVANVNSSCDDGNLCTEDICDPSLLGSYADTDRDVTGGCVYNTQANNGYNPCSDPWSCTIDTCNRAAGECQFIEIICPDDGFTCTQEYCDFMTGLCATFFNNSVCDDEDACTDDYCSVEGCFANVTANPDAIYTNTLVFKAKDTFIEMSNREENYGRVANLQVAGNSNGTMRTLLRFDDVQYTIMQQRNSQGAPTIPTTILKATLRAFITGRLTDWEDPTISVHRLKDNFCEEEATWECRDNDEQKCCIKWRMLPLGNKIAPDYELTPLAQHDITVGDAGWMNFDVTDTIRELVDNSFFNSISFLVKKDVESDPGWVTFWSCEGGRCPELLVDIEQPCGLAPVQPEPVC